MRLDQIEFGIAAAYYCRRHKSKCYVVSCHHDDGATIIVELYEDGDISGEYRSTEAYCLTPYTDGLTEVTLTGSVVAEWHERQGITWAVLRDLNGVEMCRIPGDSMVELGRWLTRIELGDDE